MSGETFQKSYGRAGVVLLKREEDGGNAMKRVIRKFTIDEISACDKPAQEYARAVIMKRAAPRAPEREITKMDIDKVDLQGLGHFACELLAKELRKENPALTLEQAYSRIFESNLDIRKAERAGAMKKLYASVARTEPEVEYGNATDTGLAALQKLADDIRKRNPFWTKEKAFAQAFKDNPDLAQQERAEAYARMNVGGTRI